MTFLGQITNPDDHAGQGNDNPAIAGQARMHSGPMYAALGLSLQDSKAVSDKKTNMLLDVMGGLNVQKLELEGEFDYRKYAGVDKAGMGFGLSAIMQTTEELAFGGRLEYLKDCQTIETETGISVGPSWRVEPGVVLRGDFSLANLKQVNATEQTYYGVMVGLVVSL
jgi:hypothetical protein